MPFCAHYTKTNWPHNAAIDQSPSSVPEGCVIRIITRFPWKFFHSVSSLTASYLTDHSSFQPWTNSAVAGQQKRGLWELKEKVFSAFLPHETVSLEFRTLPVPTNSTLRVSKTALMMRLIKQLLKINSLSFRFHSWWCSGSPGLDSPALKTERRLYQSDSEERDANEKERIKVCLL